MHAPTRISYGEMPSRCRLNLPKLLISFGILAHDVPLHPLDPTAGTRRATNTVSAIARPLITFNYIRVPQYREPRSRVARKFPSGFFCLRLMVLMQACAVE